MAEINYKVDNKAWYNTDNVYNDVILSSRVRLIRNITSYPFEVNMNDKDKRKLSSSILQLFKDKDEYQCRNYWSLDYNSIHYFQDLNLITQNKTIVDNPLFTDVIYNKDAKDTSVILNGEDHIKITSLSTGLDIEDANKKARVIENLIYEKEKFCVNEDFGYLTSKLYEAGTGCKITLRVFVPCISITSDYVHLASMLKEQKCIIKKVYTEARKEELASSIFDIYINNSMEGTLEDQIDAIRTIGIMVAEKERKLRAKVADNYPTIVLNQISQMSGKANDSLLLEYQEALNIILAMKLGLNVGLLNGITHTDLNSLCYISKGELIRSLLYKNDITFEKDVKDNNLLVQRLRAIVIQNALTGITHANKGRKG